MYFGDSVTLKKWRDIWLAEGFAEFSSWMWSEHSGDRTAQQFFNDYYKKKADELGLGAAARPTRVGPPTCSPTPSTHAAR